MSNRIEKTLGSVSLIAILSFAFSLSFAIAPAQAANVERFLGGPKGLVKNDQGVPLEGMGVQLISDRSAIRTTVYSNQDGRYEFPKLEPGTYDAMWFGAFTGEKVPLPPVTGEGSWTSPKTPPPAGRWDWKARCRGGWRTGPTTFDRGPHATRALPQHSIT
jgi:hypothetical protein